MKSCRIPKVGCPEFGTLSTALMYQNRKRISWIDSHLLLEKFIDKFTDFTNQQGIYSIAFSFLCNYRNNPALSFWVRSCIWTTNEGSRRIMNYQERGFRPQCWGLGKYIFRFWLVSNIMLLSSNWGMQENTIFDSKDTPWPQANVRNKLMVDLPPNISPSTLTPWTINANVDKTAAHTQLSSLWSKARAPSKPSFSKPLAPCRFLLRPICLCLFARF